MTQMVMLTLAEKRLSQRQQKMRWNQRERQPSQTEEGTSARCTGSTCKFQRKNHTRSSKQAISSIGMRENYQR